jgi:tetratricopeptide (TPR) repeat protein
MHSSKSSRLVFFKPESASKDELGTSAPIAIRLRALSQLGSKYYTQGNLEKAEPIFEQILQLTAESEDWNEIRANALCDLGMIQRSKGNTAAATLLYHRSLEAYDPTEDDKAKAITLANLAIAIANQGQTDRALDLLQQSLAVAEHIHDLELQAMTLANMAAIAVSQNSIDLALDLLQQSLEIAEQIGDFPGKAAMLSVMAMAIADVGEIDCAIALWQQSLELSAQMGDLPCHANALDKMAIALLRQGDIQQALTLWQQALNLKQQVGDRQGQAATLTHMAYWFGETGDPSYQLQLHLQAIQALEQIQAYPDLIQVLQHIGLSVAENASLYLAQALWLTLKIAIPPEQTINLIATFFHETPPTDELRTLLAATAHYLYTQSQPQLETRITTLLSIAATDQDIDPDTIEDWMIEQKLTEPAIFLPRLNQQLETLIGTSWLFDRDLL